MGAARKIEPRYTVEQYLEYERSKEWKSEYLHGVIYDMAGGSPTHSLIAGNAITVLGTQLEDEPCEVHTSDLKVRAGSERFFGYPDVTVVCGEPQFHDVQKDVLVNPLVIVEVLSPSTEAADRGSRWQEYQTIATLRDYLLVAQDTPRVEHYSRQAEGTWQLQSVTGLDAAVTLSSLPCILSLSRLYRRVRFPEQLDTATLAERE